METRGLDNSCLYYKLKSKASEIEVNLGDVSVPSRP
jgi:hypothetical protein